MKRYFLGMAAGYTSAQVWAHTFAVGAKRNYEELQEYLGQRYGGEAMLCKNGRSALALALKAYFEPGEAVIVNGFTCYAVYEAIRAAGLKPVWADISKEDLNYNLDTLENILRTGSAGPFPPQKFLTNTKTFSESPPEPSPTRVNSSKIKGIIIQNSLGNPVDIMAVEKFAKKHNLTIIEDLAHCVGMRYADGREAGTVGAAAALSFGKDKVIDTISGGAVILREPCKHKMKAPGKLPKISDHLRARFYPLFGMICRGLTAVRLGGALMRCLVKIHWVEKSADSRLDLERRPSKFEAKLALRQFKKLKKSGEPPIREFYLVRDREAVLAQLQRAGYYFDGLWYKKPVAPERYYRKIHFPEANCPVAVAVAERIINLPTHYGKRDLKPARKIIEDFLEEAE